jgi:AraC-like DNA-binding protein
MQVLAIHGVIGFSNESWLKSGLVKQSILSALRVAEVGVLPIQNGATAGHADLLQSVAQQLLLLNREEDADDLIKRCLKDNEPSRQERMTRSCLTGGLQSLHRSQWRTACAGLMRVVDTKNAPLPLLVQSLAALSALYFRLGMRQQALATVDCCLALLGTAPTIYELPRTMLRALKAEFIVLDLLRQHDGLHDLAFWPRHEELAGRRTSVLQARAMIQACRHDLAGYSFLQARMDMLDILIRIAYDGAPDDKLGVDYIARLQSQGLIAHAHTARHELALACIARGRSETLRELMSFYAGKNRCSDGVQHYLEHEYCMAKLGELSGNMATYVEHYRAYASRSMIQLRQTCVYITVPTMVRQAVVEIPKDDVASRLSGRYRRAYQFILTHLQREDLSVCEVAESIGVTERSLQLAFQAALGLSPSALIRRCRLDRIREDLNSGAVTHGTTTLDVGQRWGLRSRSSMSKLFKAAYGERPSHAAGLTSVMPRSLDCVNQHLSFDYQI